MSKRKKRTKTKSKKTTTKKQKTKEEVELTKADQELEKDEEVEIEAAKTLKNEAKQDEEKATTSEEDEEEYEEEEDEEDDDEEEVEDSSNHAVLLRQAETNFEQGNYQQAQAELLKVLKSNPSAEKGEQAQELLGRMEMDVRTLMVGAVAMVTLVLINTIGFLKALWTIPILFLILLLDPRFFRSPETD